MALIFAFLGTIIIIWFVAKPFLMPIDGSEMENSQSRQHLFDQKDRCVQVLKDLEFDNALQKISSEDYSQTKQVLVQELAGILRQVDESN